MNWKNRLTNYNFWISIFSAVLLILQALKIEFDIAYVNEIFTAVLGLLVVIGIISDPTRTSVKNVGETSKVKDETEQKIEETKALPIVEKSEVDKLNSQDDIQTILKKISTDLELKIQEIKEQTKETISCVEQKNDYLTNFNELAVGSAVAEMENPYLDLNN